MTDARTGPSGMTRQELIDDAIDACEVAMANLRKLRVVQALGSLERASGRADEAEMLEPTTYENRL